MKFQTTPAVSVDVLAEFLRSSPVYLVVIDDDRDAECSSAAAAAPEQQPVLQPLPVHHVQDDRSPQAPYAGLYSTAGAGSDAAHIS